MLFLDGLSSSFSKLRLQSPTSSRRFRSSSSVTVLGTVLDMEAIKKKMQAMKVEKDNLCDRCDEVEQVEPAISRHVVVDYFLKLLT